MTLIKWTGKDVSEPFHDLADMQDEMNRLMARECGCRESDGGFRLRASAWHGWNLSSAL